MERVSMWQGRQQAEAPKRWCHLPTCHCGQGEPRARLEDVGRNSQTSFLTEAALAAALVCLSVSRHCFVTQIFI